MRPIHVLGIDAQRAAMCPQLLDVVDLEAVCAQDLADRRRTRSRRSARGRSCRTGDRRAAAGGAETRTSPYLRAQQDLDSADEVVEIGNLCENVVAQDERGALPFSDELPRCLAPKNATSVGTPRSSAASRDVRRRIDPEDRNSGADEVLEEVTVVRGELDDEVVWAEPEPLADHLDVLACMLDPRTSSTRRSMRTR